VHGILWTRRDHLGVFMDARDEIHRDAITGLLLDQIEHVLGV
jgi:hypothetical protein